MKTLESHFRKYLDAPMVRPLALAAPVLVLLVALPLLRPLRHPESMTDDEFLRLKSVQALVEHGSLALDKSMGKLPGTMVLEHGTYSMQPPMMAVLLSAPAWLMTKMGFSFEENGVLFAYILTVLGVTLPVAGAAGLIYRMGRLFELRRPWRTLLACCVVAGSGLLSYSVVLNPYAPAAALLLASVACLIHVAAMNRADRRAGWFALAGACAALATALDPFAAVMLVLFMFVIPAMRFSISRRLVGVLLYILGATPVLALHAAWNNPITGDAIPASVRWFFHSQPTFPPVTFVRDDIDEEPSTSIWDTVGAHLSWFVEALVGRHGLFSHFPVMIMGMFGIGAVMHRHWPSSTKLLAAACGGGGVLIVIAYRSGRADWSSAMFATQWFVVFSPVLLFWSGAWLRRGHTMRSWVLAGIATGFSVVVGLIGATNPTPRYGYDGYTAAQALRRLVSPPPLDRGAPLAGRNS